MTSNTRFRRPRTAAAVAALTALLAACGTAAPGGSSPTQGAPGAVRVAMTDTAGPAALAAPAVGAVAKLVVNVERVELAGKDGATVAFEKGDDALEALDADGDGYPDVDLMALAGKTVELLDGAVPAGTYSQVRVFAPGEGSGSKGVYAVIGTDDVALEIPSGEQTGLKLVAGGEFTVSEGAATSVTLDFDAKRSLVATGSGRLMLKPVVRLVVDAEASAGDGETTAN